ncbi:MAG: hypothetical protein ORN57_05100, partial [Alphaproteobacteria bacterium]|nr:hypothetical protein [Alphaproteobacteria bacterium]
MKKKNKTTISNGYGFNTSLMAAAGFWLVCFSFGLSLRPLLQQSIISPLVFRLGLSAFGLVVLFLIYNYLRRRGHLTLTTAHLFLAINSLADLIVLIGLLQRPFLPWLYQVFLLYIVVFYGFYFWQR